VQAGRLDRLVQLRHRVLTSDANTGEKVQSWPTAYVFVYANKRDVRGREYFSAQQLNSEITTTWTIRYRTDVKVTDRLFVDGVAYDIVSISEIGRREGLELQTTALLTANPQT
jgi:SPP1 family predicted phage head-tail adaptor